jgi:hypothetical protein
LEDFLHRKQPPCPATAKGVRKHSLHDVGGESNTRDVTRACNE